MIDHYETADNRLSYQAYSKYQINAIAGQKTDSSYTNRITLYVSVGRMLQHLK